MSLMLPVICAGIAFLLSFRWFRGLAAITLAVVLATGHPRWTAYAVDVALPAAVGYGIVRTALWLKRRKQPAGLPAQTASCPAPTACAPARDHGRTGKRQ